MTKFRAKNIILIINAIQLIVFILLKIKDELFGDNPQIKKYDFVGICKKRKREEYKNEEEEKNFGKNIKNKNKNIDNSEEINLFNDSLFDQNGKVILRHINLFQKFV